MNALVDYVLRCEKSLDDSFDCHTFIKRLKLNISKMEP